MKVTCVLVAFVAASVSFAQMPMMGGFGMGGMANPYDPQGAINPMMGGMNPMMMGGMNPMMAGMPGMSPMMMNPMAMGMGGLANPAQLQNPMASALDTNKALDSLASLGESISAKSKSKSKVDADSCAHCDRFATELLDLSADAYPGGRAEADVQLCDRVSAEFKNACVSYVNAHNGLEGVDVMLQDDRDSICDHVEQCQAMLATSAEDTDAAEADDADSDSAEADDEESGDNSFGVDMNDLVDTMKRSNAVQMMNSKQMSDMELMNNALKLHDMQMHPFLHELPCVNPDDAECQSGGLIHGMNYLMMSGTMPDGGLRNGGLSLAMVASAYPQRPLDS